MPSRVATAARKRYSAIFIRPVPPLFELAALHNGGVLIDRVDPAKAQRGQNMVQGRIALEHRGRMSVAVVSGTVGQLDTFRRFLLQEAFIVGKQGEGYLEFYRKARVLKDDWPMIVRIRRYDARFEIQCSMFIPWSWIGTFAALAVLFLPVLKVAGGPPLLFFGLALAVVMIAVAKQRFDLSPRASWQSRPRKRWNALVERWLANAFGQSER
jgi:hypothetical protein